MTYQVIPSAVTNTCLNLGQKRPVDAPDGFVKVPRNQVKIGDSLVEFRAYNGTDSRYTGKSQREGEALIVGLAREAVVEEFENGSIIQHLGNIRNIYRAPRSYEAPISARASYNRKDYVHGDLYRFIPAHVHDWRKQKSIGRCEHLDKCSICGSTHYIDSSD